jgi:hypothetical protein
MNKLSLNTAILSFAFSGILAPHQSDRETRQDSSHAADEATARAHWEQSPRALAQTLSRPIIRGWLA